MSKVIFSNSDVDYIIKEHFVSIRSIKDICKEFGVAHGTIKKVIVDNGRIPLNFNKWVYGAICLKACIALYRYGIGIRGVAERLDVPIQLLISEFKRQGINLRTQSEQESIKWTLMTKEQRAYQVKGAHKAMETYTPTIESLIKMSNSRSRRTSVYETKFADYLTSRGIAFKEQVPIHIYNVDFIVGNVAVEIFGGNWHSFGAHAARFRKRSEEIFNSGYSLAILTIGEPNTMTDSVCSNFVELINIFNSDKSSIGKYGVVWSTSNFITTGSIDDIERALIRPSTNVRDRVTGRYESIPR